MSEMGHLREAATRLRQDAKDAQAVFGKAGDNTLYESVADLLDAVFECYGYVCDYHLLAAALAVADQVSPAVSS